MDIEQFYDEDPRRRESDEVELGRDWTDDRGVRHEISWVADTGEVYAMREPDAAIDMDPVGDTFEEDLPMDSVTVEVLAVVPDRADLDARLAGWEDAMTQPGSLGWVRERLAAGT
ncbi:MAG TPA: hypothetical protein VEP49_20090 [Acidimicrobiia bacterium]|nr:hypothetical protein [Acidimicrobiia bacterium]